MAKKTVKVVTYDNQGKGNKFNTASKKWEVDLVPFVKVGSGLQVTQAGDLQVKAGQDFAIDASGSLILANVGPKTITNFVNGNFPLGFHTFTGDVNKSERRGGLGLPKDWNGTATEQDRTLRYEDYVDGTAYDYNGYYIASDKELSIWVANADATYYISNDYGVNPDGSLKNVNGWGKWQKLDNVAGVSTEMIKSMQNQINGLINRVVVLENRGKVTTKDFKYNNGIVVHRQAIIDHGTYVEATGVVELPLRSPRYATASEASKKIMDNAVILRYGTSIYQDLVYPADSRALGLADNGEQLYYTETRLTIPYSDLGGIRTLLGATATVTDISSYRKENAFILNSGLLNAGSSISLGVQTYFKEGQDTITLSYMIKGLK